MRIACAMIAAVLALTATPPSAEEVSDFDRFQLWHYCLPTDLVVEGLPKDAANIGLTKKAITIAVRSRLRAARLYEAEAPFTYLYVNVAVLSRAYSIDIAYNK